ncbi:MAG: hypothetical protein NTU83_02910, partial [Candidatus Hydrogenedentes bacterium]|nr:hypothetical protein [Candidatus Hydrogenedentota bacterium]
MGGAAKAYRSVLSINKIIVLARLNPSGFTVCPPRPQKTIVAHLTLPAKVAFARAIETGYP